MFDLFYSSLCILDDFFVFRPDKHGPHGVIKQCKNSSVLNDQFYMFFIGVVRTLHERNRLLHCYCTETRPYNQGARLTAYELVHDKIPSTLICDSMASMLMKDR